MKNIGAYDAPVERVVARIQAVYSQWGRGTSVAQMRADWDAVFVAHASDCSFDIVDAGGVESVWIEAPNARPDRVVLYFHGGGFRLGSIHSHRDLMERISRAGAARVLGVSYRLAPEHSFPAPIEDALTTWRWLLAQNIAADRVIFAGDSAGGGLAISAMLAARQHNLPLPAGAVLMSAWTDLEANGGSYVTRADRDPIHQRGMILDMAKGYLGAGGNASDALASPLHGDLAGLPPVLVQCGGRETVLDDSIMFADKARAAGVAVDLEIEDDMIHVFQMFAAELDEGRAAIDRVGAFIKRHAP